ncbi:MAG: hypothetical protein K1Y36_22195 [Blastocatellia bacterium]|nr:hypothetical protein [Blastocatellia bacterium]
MSASTNATLFSGGRAFSAPTLRGTVGTDGQNNQQDVLTIQRLLNQIIKHGHLQKFFGATVPENGNPRDGYTWMVVRKIQEIYNLPRNRMNAVTIAPGDATYRKLVHLSTTYPALPSGIPNFSGLNPKESFNLCLRYIKQKATGNSHPVLQDLENGKRVILSFRKTTSTKANQGRGLYDDVTIVLWKRNEAEHFVYSFESNTEPAAYYDQKFGSQYGNSRQKFTGNDADRDGVADLGRIPDGIYRFGKDYKAHFGKQQEAVGGKKHGYNILKPRENITAERDINHDGKFDEADRKLIKKQSQMNSGQTFYFHRGGKGGFTGSGGCQTMKQPVFDAFWEKLGQQQEFYYVLITVA